MKQLMKKPEHLLELGRLKTDIVLLAPSGVAVVCSLLKFQPLLFDLSWIAIVLCGLPIILETVIGLVTAFDGRRAGLPGADRLGLHDRRRYQRCPGPEKGGRRHRHGRCDRRCLRRTSDLCLTRRAPAKSRGAVRFCAPDARLFQNRKKGTALWQKVQICSGNPPKFMIL